MPIEKDIEGVEESRRIVESIERAGDAPVYLVGLVLLIVALLAIGVFYEATRP